MQEELYGTSTLDWGGHVFVFIHSMIQVSITL